MGESNPLTEKFYNVASMRFMQILPSLVKIEGGVTVAMCGVLDLVYNLQSSRKACRLHADNQN